MNPKRIVELLGRLALLRFFPTGNDAALEGLLVLVGDMCNSEAEVEWLVKRMTSGIYAEWPGPQEMRACYCDKFRPKDGINAYSQVYPDGLPPSKDSTRSIAGPDLKALPPGSIASADPVLEKTVHILAKTNEITNNLGGPATEEEIRTAPRWLRQLEGYE